MRQCPKCGRRFLETNARICDADGSVLDLLVVASERDRLVGTTILGRYAVDGVLGDGGMGVVYSARDIENGGRYAVKVLRAEYSAEEDLVVRFEQEARAAASINNPHIVEIYDWGSLPDNSRFFVMEYLEGSSLGDVLARMPKPAGSDRRQPMSESLTIHLAMQICEGLGVAHAIGIVHRDIKPDNFHIVRKPDEPYFVKILDFGIAKVQNSKAARTRTGSVFGTPHYMSPEQARGELIDPRADIWALGVVMYECLTGEIPFDGENYNQQILAVVTEEHKRATTLGIEAELSALIDRCLEKDRNSRFASAADMLQEISAYLARHPEIAVRQALLRIPGPEEFPTARPDDPTTLHEVVPGLSRERDTVEDLTEDAQPAGTDDFAGPLSIRPVFPGMVRIDDEHAADSAPTKVHAVKVSAVVEGGAAPVPLSQRPGYQRFESTRPGIFRAPSLPPLPPPPRLPIIEVTPSGIYLPRPTASSSVEFTQQGTVPSVDHEIALPPVATYPRPRRWLFLSAAFLSGLLVALGVVTLSRDRERPRPIAALNIRVRLLGMREDARPVIGGVRYFSNEAYVPRTTRPLRVRVEADGFESLEVTVIPDRDRDVVLPEMLPVPAPVVRVAPAVVRAPATVRAVPVPMIDSPTRVRPTNALTLPTSVLPGLAPSAPSGVPELAVGSNPRCRVLVDGVAVGQTPLFHLSLPVGHHQITCERPSGTLNREVEIVIGAHNTRVFFDEH